ncbi:MAG TPA: hypothetical protein VK911_17220 [Vicinamibacterales bacterium]|nr:hypothetical protein [Vicinamibacterales bacterium]
MLRGFGAFVVAATVGVFAAGDVAAQTTPTTEQSTQSTTTQAQEQQGQENEAEARQRLVEARESLAELAKMPEAGQLQGQPRTEVTEMISNFNALLTAEENWYEQYKLVMQNLHNVLGPASEGAAGTAGTTGSTAGTTGTTAGEEVPAALREKLTEFRERIMAFGRAAGAPDVMGGVSGRTSGSASPAGSATAGTSGAAGTTAGAAQSSGAAQTAAGTSSASDTLEYHLDAISSIIQESLSGQPTAPGAAGTTGSTSGTTGSTTSGTTGSAGTPGAVTIEREKLDRIQSHLQRVREIAREKGIK